MSPLDDELRAVLHSRAGSVSPSPDPLAGIERRATGMRRRRTAASVVGSALAVTAIALAVPALTPTASGPAPQVATSTAPTAPAPETVAPMSPYVLDPAAPWPYRGTPVADLGTQFLDAVTTEYATRRGVEASDVRLTPLFGQIDEPSAASELVFLATVDGEDRWGVAVSSEAGPEFRVDEQLPSPPQALAAALPGDEIARLLVVTAPDAGEVQYGPDDASEFAPLTAIADGVWIGPLEGDPATDTYRLLDPAGDELVREAAPDPAPGGTGAPDAASPSPGDLPDNLLDWPSRGSARPELLEQALGVFATAVGTVRDDVDGRLLYGGSDDTGREFVHLQAWRLGQDAQLAGLTTGGGQPDTPFLGPYLDEEPAVLAFVVPAGTGQTTDTLVVLPEPGTGQVLYAPDGTSKPSPVLSNVEDGVWLVDRDPRALDDALLVLDGDGDLDAPIYRGAVAPLLCGAKGCG